MSILNKAKQCAGTMGCRFRWVLRLAVLLLVLGIALVLLLFAGDAA